MYLNIFFIKPDTAKMIHLMFDVYCYKKIDFSATKKLDAFSTKAALYLIYTHNMYDWENIWQKGSAMMIFSAFEMSYVWQHGKLC